MGIWNFFIKPDDLTVIYDDKRFGYRVSGAGFDFFAYFTGDFTSPFEWVECDSVEFRPSGVSFHMSIPHLRGAGDQVMNEGALKAAIVREIKKFGKVLLDVQ